MVLAKHTIIWLILIALTILTFSIGKMGGLNSVRDAMILLILATTFIKAAMVSEYFMELRGVKTFWRIIPIIYLLVVLLLIRIFY